MKIVKFKYLFLAAGILWAGTKHKLRFTYFLIYGGAQVPRLQMNPGLAAHTRLF